jgi:acetyl-CoA carboxylase biotin carboxyl carrier protein
MKGGGKRSTRAVRQATSRTSQRADKTGVGAGRNGKRAADPGGHPTVELARQLAAIVESHSLTELVMDTPELTLTFRRGDWTGGAPAVSLPASAPAALPAAPVPLAQPGPALASSPAAAAASAEPDHHLVTSPFVGTFYRSPGPDSDPYVSEGQRVEKGQVLCIVEAMKLMNEIEADQSGVIAAILVQNAQPVEYGQALFKISPA